MKTKNERDKKMYSLGYNSGYQAGSRGKVLPSQRKTKPVSSLSIFLAHLGMGNPLNKLVTTNSKKKGFMPYTRRHHESK